MRWLTARKAVAVVGALVVGGVGYAAVAGSQEDPTFEPASVECASGFGPAVIIAEADPQPLRNAKPLDVTLPPPPAGIKVGPPPRTPADLVENAREGYAALHPGLPIASLEWRVLWPTAHDTKAKQVWVGGYDVLGHLKVLSRVERLSDGRLHGAVHTVRCGDVMTNA